ncbi:MAG: response regulator, partial [Campylobacterales bacterium]|nr:response regulator [Campylobacterales bacterium]
ELVFEESDAAFYLTLRGTGAIKEKILTAIMQRHLPHATYLLGDDTVHFELLKRASTSEGSLVIDEEAKHILSKTHENGINAREYVDTTAVSFLPKIEALEDLEYRLDTALIAFEDTPDTQHLEEVCQHFASYHEVLALLSDFAHLAFGISSLLAFLRNLHGQTLEPVKTQQLATLLLHLLHDLCEWRNQIFITQEAINIHYLDASLLSSCMQIEALFENKTIDEGDDLEFF